MPYEVVTPGEGNENHSVPSTERKEAIEVARLAAEAKDLIDEALWNARDLQCKLTTALYESRRVVARCERAHQSSVEVYIAAEEAVERLCDLASPPSIDSLVVDRLRQERALQDQESDRKKRKAKVDLDDGGPAGSLVSFEKRIQRFAFVRGTS